MRIRMRHLPIAVFLLGVGACVAPTVETEPVSTEPVSAALGPMAQPAWTVGDTRVLLTNDGDRTYAITAVNETSYVEEVAETGCVATQPADGIHFWLQWNDACGINEGRSSLEIIESDVWPLEVGKTWRYRLAGSARTGDKWDRVGRCTVAEEVRVSVRAGAFDTFHVACEDVSFEYHRYLAPAIGREVLSQFIPRFQGMAPLRHELISFTAGTAE